MIIPLDKMAAINRVTAIAMLPKRAGLITRIAPKKSIIMPDINFRICPCCCVNFFCPNVQVSINKINNNGMT